MFCIICLILGSGGSLGVACLTIETKDLGSITGKSNILLFFIYSYPRYLPWMSGFSSLTISIFHFLNTLLVSKINFFLLHVAQLIANEQIPQ